MPSMTATLREDQTLYSGQGALEANNGSPEVPMTTCRLRASERNKKAKNYSSLGVHGCNYNGATVSPDNCLHPELQQSGREHKLDLAAA